MSLKWWAFFGFLSPGEREDKQESLSSSLRAILVRIVKFFVLKVWTRVLLHEEDV